MKLNNPCDASDASRSSITTQTNAGKNKKEKREALHSSELPITDSTARSKRHLTPNVHGLLIFYGLRLQIVLMGENKIRWRYDYEVRSSNCRRRRKRVLKEKNFRAESRETIY